MADVKAQQLEQVVMKELILPCPSCLSAMQSLATNAKRSPHSANLSARPLGASLDVCSVAYHPCPWIQALLAY